VRDAAIAPGRLRWLVAGVFLSAAAPLLVLWGLEGWTLQGLTTGAGVATGVITLWAAGAAMFALRYAKDTVAVARQSEQSLRLLIDRIESVAQREERVVQALDRQHALASHIEAHERTIQSAQMYLVNLQSIARPLASTFAAGRAVVATQMQMKANKKSSEDLLDAGNELLREYAPLEAGLLLLPDAILPLLREFAGQVRKTAEADDVDALNVALDEDRYIAVREQYLVTLAEAWLAFENCIVEEPTS
jgi:hypothetical protein